ncbi:MAG TPA: aldolase/citrate lyase family protein [Rectinemataceae bacterium]|nr:aldolase/citrate lyase family protein [Rectinemataceae bacterium]
MDKDLFRAGSRAKSDCSVTYERNGAPLTATVSSSVGSLFGKAIAAAALRVAAEFGVEAGSFTIDDDGALDGTVAARAEASLRLAGFARIPGVAPAQAPAAARPANARAASPRGRPRRARLYLPGDQPHLAVNAGLFGADCLVFDLEDAVVAERKFETRILVRRVLEENLMLGNCEIAVRVNPLSGPWGKDDLAEIVKARPHAIVLPKCEFAADVEVADREISVLEEAVGIPAGIIHLMLLIETAAGALNAKEIAAASSRNVALLFGHEDFSRDIKAVPIARSGAAVAAIGGRTVDRADGASAQKTQAASLADFGIAAIPGAESLLARQMIVLAARAAKIDPLDSTYADVGNEEGLRASCEEARALGFAGKGVLHPAQIPIVMKAFRPTEEEALRAEKIVAAFDAAAAEGRGAISVDGAMVDAPVAEKARGILRDYRGTL